MCVKSWGKARAWMHLSSPIKGWKEKDVRAHADFINPRDVPTEWMELDVTVDVEAKAKELAVLKLTKWVNAQARITTHEI